MSREDVEVPHVRIFISSPGDVKEERAVALSVIRQLQVRFQGRLVLMPILWEQEPLLATAGFQQEIDRRAAPSSTDVAVFILWSRLGSPLSKDFELADGRRPTGTEWEFEDAVRGHEARDLPHILVYRRAEPPTLKITDARYEMRRADFQAVEAFFESRFKDATDLTFTGSYHKYGDPADFARNLDGHLRQVLNERLARGSVAPSWTGSPFRGLETFEAEHAPIFQGRVRAVYEVRSRLVAQVAAGRAFVLLLGRSGNGKSSLARAGILPFLAGPWLVEKDVPGGFCRPAILKPSDAPTPLRALTRALLEESALSELGNQGDEAELAATFAESPKACVGAVRGALSRLAQTEQERRGLAEPPAARLLLLVDQLEELFTTSGVGAEDREEFAAVLDALARSGDAYVLATLRSDFYPAFSQLDLLMALKAEQGQYDVPPLDPAEIRQTITVPAQMAGLEYETDPETQKGLDEVLLAESTGEPDALPLLEYALTQLEEEKEGHRLTFAAYERMGRLEGAIATRAAAEYDALPEDAKAAFPRVLRALMEVSEGQEGTATRRRAPRSDLARIPGGSDFVGRFVRARLLVLDGEGEGAVVSVAHEALLRAALFRDRIREEGQLLGLYSTLRARTAAWEQAGRPRSLLLAVGKPLDDARLLVKSRFDLTPPEAAFVDASEDHARRAAFWKRFAVATIGVLALGALGLALFALRKQAEAQDERDRKAEALEEVTRERDRVNRLSDAKRVRDLEDEAETLNLASPDLQARLESWLATRDALVAAGPGHDDALERLRVRATAPGPPWEFESEQLAWQHEVLTDLVARIGVLAAPDHRLAMRVDRLRTSALARTEADEAHAARWKEVAAQVAGSERYGGLRLVQQRGLVPLGESPEGLFEFALVGSGPIPQRDPDTKELVLGDEFAVIFVLLPRGTFTMGDISAWDNSPRQVTLSPFFLAKHECTQAQWAALAGLNPALDIAPSRDEGPRRPVERVSWNDCVAVLDLQGLALPTEAQWEYACRAGTTTPWWTASDEQGLLEAAWLEDNSGGETHPVGTTAGGANAFGLHDTHGNVWEWCQDAYVTGLPADPPPDPVVLKGSGGRVFRGGSWDDSAGFARSAYRYWSAPGIRGSFLGVRPARAVTPD